MSKDCQSIKVVVVGDGGIGKTCMLSAFTGGLVNPEYSPTIFDNLESFVYINGIGVKISLWDTAGQEGFQKIRSYSYYGADLFIICHSVVEPTSFRNIRDKWIPEIRHICPDTPLVIVGLKADLRRDVELFSQLLEQNVVPMSADTAEASAASLGSLRYFECSAYTRENLKEIFDYAFEEALKRAPARKKKKTIKSLKNKKCLIC